MTFRKTLLLLTLAAACAGVQAQSTPAKKELVGRILKIQQPGIEAMARELAKQPVNELMMNAGEYLQTQVPADKREALAKGLQQDAEKYMNEVYPMVRERAVKLAPTTVGALLEEKFSEDELKQVIAMMESPVYVKFQSMGVEMERALISKLVPELRPQIAPKLRALDETMSKRLGLPPTNAQGAAPAPAAAAKPPAKK
jgi:uncharacterized protein